MRREQQPTLTPTDVIIVLNRSCRTIQECNRHDTREAAEKAFHTCHHWLRAHKIPFHQDPTGEWVLDGKGSDTT